MPELYDIPLFDVPAAAPSLAAIPNAPLGAPKAWTDAVIAADMQCQDERQVRGRGKPVRCDRTLRGGHRLYLHGKKVWCQKHFDEQRKAGKP